MTRIPLNRRAYLTALNLSGDLFSRGRAGEPAPFAEPYATLSRNLFPALVDAPVIRASDLLPVTAAQLAGITADPYPQDYARVAL